jgi:hypothetical protein
MGYPMTWRRLVFRHGFTGGYDGEGEYGDDIGAPQWMSMAPERFKGKPRDPVREPHKNTVAGDMRRLEADQRDEEHLTFYAEASGITPDQAKKVLDAFFEGKH